MMCGSFVYVCECALEVVDGGSGGCGGGAVCGGQRGSLTWRRLAGEYYTRVTCGESTLRVVRWSVSLLW